MDDTNVSANPPTVIRDGIALVLGRGTGNNNTDLTNIRFKVMLH